MMVFVCLLSRIITRLVTVSDIKTNSREKKLN